MKLITKILLTFFFIQSAYGQEDSYALISKRGKIIPVVNIILVEEEIAIKESYSLFKGVYFLKEVDTISLISIQRMGEDYKEIGRKKSSSYQRLKICDPEINLIRNRSQYFRIKSNIDRIARTKIGYDNSQFKEYDKNKTILSKFFKEECFQDFNLRLNDWKINSLSKINLILEEKNLREKEFKALGRSINKKIIKSFLEDFNSCNSDLNILETIIINNPEGFLIESNDLEDSEFYRLSYILNNFTKECDTNKLKKSLKKTDFNGKRKKRIIRSIKNGG